MSMKRAHPSHPQVPISKAVRAGDLVFTSAYGPWLFDPKDLVFNAEGDVIDDGSGQLQMPFEDQVHRTIEFIRSALALEDCSLADVVKSECWISEARYFKPFSEIYRTYFLSDPPVRSVFPVKFNFCCKLEMQVIAYKPLKA